LRERGFIFSQNWQEGEDIVKMGNIELNNGKDFYVIKDERILPRVFFKGDDGRYRNLFNLYESTKGEHDSGRRVEFNFTNLEGKVLYEEAAGKNPEKPPVLQMVRKGEVSPRRDPIKDLILGKYKNSVDVRETSQRDNLVKKVETYNPLKERSEFGKSLSYSLRSVESRFNQLNYSGKMCDYSVQQQQVGDNLTAVITKILAGDYRGRVEDLQQGDLKEDTQQGYIWLWKDRVGAVKAIIESQEKEYAKISREKKKIVQTILGEQNYLRRKRDKEYQELINLFS